MSQPPQPPQPSTPHDPQESAPGAAGPGAHSAVPQQAEAPAKSGLGKGPILAIVGCGLLVVVLVLALVAFFGVRALMDDDDSVVQPTASQAESPAEEESSEPEEETTTEEATTEEESSAPEEPAEPTEPSEEAAATGEANAVPQGTVLTLEQPGGTEGTLDIVIGDVNWDAAAWVAEQNSHNPEPTDQGRYIMVEAEVTYHGSAEFSSSAFMPVDYVAADGTPYEEAGVVTPNTMDKLALHDGGTGTLYWVFMMPKDVPEGGHFVIADGLPQDEALVEGQWVQAA